MKEKMRRCVSVLMLAVLLLSPVMSMNAKADTTDPVAAYEAKLKAARELKEQYEQQKAEAEAMIEQFSAEMTNIQQYIEDLDLKLNDVSMTLFELGKTIEETAAELEITKKELAEAKRREEEQYRIMCERVRYIYENGETTYWDVLINSSDISQLLNQIEYVSDIQEYDNSLLERYEAAKLKVEQKEAYLEASLDELKTLEEQEKLNQQTIEQMINLKQQEIENLSEELGLADEYLFTYLEEISSQEIAIEQIIKDEEERVAEEERKRKEEEERLARLEAERIAAAKKAAEEAAARRAAEEAAAAANEKKYDETAIEGVVLSDERDPFHMIWPLPGDHRTYSKFGYRKAPIAGASTYHQGWDIGGKYGAPIVSVLAGTVIAASYNSTSGNYVRVDHGDGFVTVYCHCSKLLVSVGDEIQQGTIIGLIGSTGVSTGSHLHFGIKLNGTYIDPDPYIGPLE